MNINEHPIYKAIYELCLEIEKLPASEQETKVVVMASALENPVRDLLNQKKVLVEAAKLALDWFETGPADFSVAAEIVVPALEQALEKAAQ